MLMASAEQQLSGSPTESASQKNHIVSVETDGFGGEKKRKNVRRKKSTEEAQRRICAVSAAKSRKTAVALTAASLFLLRPVDRKCRATSKQTEKDCMCLFSNPH